MLQAASDGRNDPRLEGLCDELEGSRIVGRADLDRARRVAGQSDERLDRVLAKLGLVTEERLVETWSRLLDLPCLAADCAPGTSTHGLDVEAEFLHRHRILPLEHEGGRLRVATADPLESFPLDAIAFATRSVVEPILATPSAIASGLKARYPLDAPAPGQDSADEAAAVDSEDVERLKDLASDAPVVRFVNQLLEQAAAARASDIHLEPQAGGMSLRLRVDGLLRHITPPPPHLARAVVSRIKIMARLDIAECRLPQDGRSMVTVGGRKIDLRVATAPAEAGETVVVRLLDKAGGPLTLDALGHEPAMVGLIREALAAPSGLVLVTGPTGSGKTTTLYAALAELTVAERKLMTVEDPVEYQLQGATQLQVKPQIGLTFARLLRSILRHDPDVVMVGEIRDRETAEIAIEAALTGHLVLSTLHTNSAAAAITRLLEMGVPNYLLAASLRGAMAQRLVRRLCEHCREPDPDAAERGAALGLGGDLANRLLRARGCRHCDGTGYYGRIGVAEWITVDRSMRDLIRQSADEDRIAQSAGGARLLDDGLLKAGRGQTTLDEIWRLTSSLEG